MRMDIERIRALYPRLSDEELETARENLVKFAAFVWEECERRAGRDRLFDKGNAPPYDQGKVDSQQT